MPALPVADQSAAPLAPRWMLPVICSAAFLVFAQTFMVAPLLPRLAVVFHSPVAWVALAIPAYVIPQGLSILFAGPWSDRLGRRAVILGSLLVFTALTAATATARHIDTFIAWRIVTGVGQREADGCHARFAGDVDGRTVQFKYAFGNGQS